MSVGDDYDRQVGPRRGHVTYGVCVSIYLVTALPPGRACCSRWWETMERVRLCYELAMETARKEAFNSFQGGKGYDWFLRLRPDM